MWANTKSGAWGYVYQYLNTQVRSFSNELQFRLLFSLSPVKILNHPHMTIFISLHRSALASPIALPSASLRSRNTPYSREVYLKCLWSTQTGTKRNKPWLPTGLINNKKLQGVHEECCLPSSFRDAWKRFLPLKLPSMKRVSQISDIFSTCFIRWQCIS